jgi:hypothetical protein
MQSMSRVVRICFLTGCLGLAGLLAGAGSMAADTVDEILVTGERPGPALWRVSQGDHELWILATLTPLPKNMVWRSEAVAQRIASSQVLISSPQLTSDIGFFRGMTLIPALLRARRSPDGKTLEEGVPHELYIRWLALRVKYLSRSDEKIRPLLAALDLYTSALDQVGLTLDDDKVWDVVKGIASAHHVPIARVNLKVAIEDPKGAIRSLDQIPPDAEIACLSQTVERLEVDLPAIIRRANLWSLGDVDGLRAMPEFDEDPACENALLTVPQLQSKFSQVDTGMNNAWLVAAQKALNDNLSSFSVLSIGELIKPDGLLAKLRAQGYTVEEPGAQDK